MQSVAMQVKKNDQAAVMSMAAPSSYCRKPSWMDGGEPPTNDEKGRVWLTEHRFPPSLKLVAAQGCVLVAVWVPTGVPACAQRCC